MLSVLFQSWYTMIKDFPNLNLLNPPVLSCVINITSWLWGLPESADGLNKISKLLLSCRLKKKMMHIIVPIIKYFHNGLFSKWFAYFPRNSNVLSLPWVQKALNFCPPVINTLSLLKFCTFLKQKSTLRTQIVCFCTFSLVEMDARIMVIELHLQSKMQNCLSVLFLEANWTTTEESYRT